MGGRGGRGAGRAGRLRIRLEERRPEIEAAALARVSSIADPAEVSDPAYAEGLHAAVAAAVEYGIQTTGREGGDPPIPVALLAQARTAARAAVPLDTVLRRYFAGYSLLGYFILEEAGRAGISDGAKLQRLLGAHAGLFDRLLAAVGEEHRRETGSRMLSSGERQEELIARLLKGELIDTAAIPYDFEGWHLGVVVAGRGAGKAIDDLSRPPGCNVLSVQRDEVIWAWLGTRSVTNAPTLHRLCPASVSTGVMAAFGAPGEGLAGWRLTHRQAAAALPVAQRGPQNPVHYADVALLAAAIKDETLATSLRQQYLRPLEAERDRGHVLRETLRAYFAADGSLSSAASAIGVSARTIRNRLRRAEIALGRPLGVVRSQAETALRLDELDRRS